ncbi:uncharacterized protein EAE97_004317 [Botrytis byssoidea]|uniref:Transmembrane protein n=1 Tax=Botrytis byssoidea TaxID=139641 RepID=A0A9P5ITT0_9HELO|nr:uncharacterized protein EAE97_004317 [Botrytis byssoidea]KAF7947068.1 hypothetical protein EAE97_004317 [Botrytis byssoidea]
MPPLPTSASNLRPNKLLQNLFISILYLLTMIITLFSVLVIASTWTFFMLDYNFENLSVTVLSGVAEVVLSSADRLCDFVGLEMTDERFYYFGWEEEEEEEEEEEW